MGQIKSWEVSDPFWARVEPFIPPRQRDGRRTYRRRPGGGRKPMESRRIFSAIVYVLRTGIQWKALPRSFGSASAIHKHFQAWQRAGFFLRLWREGLAELVRWKASLGIGKVSMEPCTRPLWLRNAPAPIRRIGEKKGRKRSLLVDGRGVPLPAIASGANVHDVKLLPATLERIVVARPQAPRADREHLCGDAAYKGKPAQTQVLAHGYQPHIKQRKEEAQAKREGCLPRR